MTQLSQQLQRLAAIAWQNGLRGQSLEKSSLLFPLDDVLQKLSYAGGAADVETLKAAAVQDIFDHLSRIADDRYKPGRKKWEAAKSVCGRLVRWCARRRLQRQPSQAAQRRQAAALSVPLLRARANRRQGPLKSQEELPTDEIPVEDEVLDVT